MMDTLDKEAVKLYLKEGTTIEVLFEDGITKRYDVMRLLRKYPQIKALQNRDLFLRGELIGWGTIYWNDDLDLDPLTVYEFGTVVPPEENTVPILLGYKIHKARLEKELSLDELSQQTGLSFETLKKLEKGETDPSPSLLEKIAAPLSTTPEALLS